MNEYQLKDREKAILRFVIHQFILTANPVGSRNFEITVEKEKPQSYLSIKQKEN